VLDAARSPIASLALRVGTAAALAVDAVVHWQNAPAYDGVAASLSQGELFRAEAVVAVVVGLWVLVRPQRGGWVAAALVGASALAAVLLYRYVDVGALGPLPDMYESTWQVPGKLLSAYAEGAAVVLAGLGLLTHRATRQQRRARGASWAGRPEAPQEPAGHSRWSWTRPPESRTRTT
jgi:hypothetical protein